MTYFSACYWFSNQSGQGPSHLLRHQYYNCFMVEMFLPNSLSPRLWEWVAKTRLVGYRLKEAAVTSISWLYMILILVLV